MFLLVFTSFYWFLLVFTGFYQVFTSFYWVLLGITEFYQFLPVFTGFYRVSPCRISSSISSLIRHVFKVFFYEIFSVMFLNFNLILLGFSENGNKWKTT